MLPGPQQAEHEVRVLTTAQSSLGPVLLASGPALFPAL